jgi:hypothetical protein
MNKLTNQQILETKNIQAMKQVLGNAGIYHGELSEPRLVENFKHYMKIGRL